MRLTTTLTFILFALSMYSQSIDCLDKSNLNPEEVSNYTLQIKSDINGNEDLRIQLSEKLYCHGLKNSNDSLIGFSYNQLGLAHYQLGAKAKALFYLKSAEKILALDPSNLEYLKNQNYLGLLFELASDYTTAIKHLSHCIENAKKYKAYPSYIADVENDLGLIYLELGDYDLTKKYLDRAKQILEKDGDLYGLGYSLLNLGRNEFINKENYGQAEVLLNDAMQIWKQLDFDRGQFYTQNAYSELFLKSDLNKAKQHIDRTIELAQKNKFKRLENVYLNKGKIYYGLGLTEIALSSFNEARIEAKLNNSDEVLNEVYPAIIRHYSNSKNIDSIQHYLNAYGELNISSVSKYKKNQREWSNLVNQYENLSSQFEKSERTISSQKMLIALFGFLVLLSGILTYSLIRTRNKLQESFRLSKKQTLETERINQELNISNETLRRQQKELIKQSQMIKEQNDELVSFSDKKLLLLNSRKDFFDEMKIELSKINDSNPEIKRLQQFVDARYSDPIWQDIDRFANKELSAFKTKLVSLYPNLTQKDVQLSNFIRMNLNTKDIAKISYQNPESVKVARSRLRKKLGITDPKVNLYQFLSQI